MKRPPEWVAPRRTSFFFTNWLYLSLWKDLFRHLSLSTDVSIPLVQATEEWLNAGRHTFYVWQLAEVKRLLKHLKAGLPFSEFVRKNSSLFPSEVCETLLASPDERSLPYSLKLAAARLAEKISMVRRIKQAAFYPLIVLTVLALVTQIYQWKVLPTFTAFLAARGIEFPFPVRIYQFTYRRYTFFLGIIAAIVVTWNAFPRSLMHRLVEGAFLRIPLLRDRILFEERARLLKALVLLSQNHLLPETLQSVSDHLKTEICRNDWHEFVRKLQSGEPWNDALKNLGFVSPDIQFVLRTLNRNSDAHQLLGTTLCIYQEKLDATRRIGVRIAEPAFIVLLGLWVGLAVYSMYWPIFHMLPYTP